jgi:predicted metal-binding membrane protein
VTIAAGAGEFTPLKRHLRRRCRESAGPGLGFGLCCVGSSIGLMAILVALGVMSVGWIAVIAALVTAQKLTAFRGFTPTNVQPGAMCTRGLVGKPSPATRPPSSAQAATGGGGGCADGPGIQ